MSLASKLSLSLDNLTLPASRLDLNDLSIQSFINNHKHSNTRLETSLLIDQQSAKLEKIQKKALQLSQKERKERNILIKLKEICEHGFEKFSQIKKIEKQKQKEIDSLKIENTQLKREVILYSTQKQALYLQNSKLNHQIRRVAEKLSQVQQNCKSLESELYQQNQLKSFSATFDVGNQTNQNLRLAKDFELYQKQINANSENQKIKNERISIYNYFLQNLLKKIDLTEQKEGEVEEGKSQTEKSETKFLNLAGQLIKKAEKLSETFSYTKKLQRDLKLRDHELKNLQDQLNSFKQKCQSLLLEVSNCKLEIQCFQDSQKFRFQTELENGHKVLSHFNKFQEDLLELFETKMLEEHKFLYDSFTTTTKQLFKAWRMNIGLQNNSFKKFIQTAVLSVENNLLIINSHFQSKAKFEAQRFEQIVHHFQKSNALIDNHQNYQKEGDYILDQKQSEGKSISIQSTPEKFPFLNPMKHSINHSWENSEPRGKSCSNLFYIAEKSIALGQDMENAIICSDQMDQIQEYLKNRDTDNKNIFQVLDNPLSENQQIADQPNNFEIKQNKTAQFPTLK